MKTLQAQIATLNFAQIKNVLGGTSSAIRRLNADGYSRSEIAKILNIKYQHVRNVLITPIKSARIVEVKFVPDQIDDDVNAMNVE